MKGNIQIPLESITKKIEEVKREYAAVDVDKPTIDSVCSKSEAIGKISILRWLLKSQ
jgi:hypothetical protein